MSSDRKKPIHYRHDLDIQLATCIQEFEDERAEYWRTPLSGADWDLQEGILGHAEAIAQEVLHDTERMVSNKAKDGGTQFEIEREAFVSSINKNMSELREMLKAKFQGQPIPPKLWDFVENKALEDRPQSDTLGKMVWERICITLANDVVENRLVQGANRLMQLVGMVVQTEAPPPTIEFLRRVSRCFTWGFDPECVILCRGAIETAFKEAVADEVCAKFGEPDAKFGYTLAQRIKAAQRTGLIDRKAEKAAWRVNALATDAAHKSPDAGANVLNTIRDAVMVIQKIGMS